MASVPMPSFVSFTKTWHNKPYPFISPSRPALSAAGKTIVITGGGSGIGKAIAIAFAEAGAKAVAIIGRREDRLARAAVEVSAAGSQTQVLYETGDVTSRTSVEAALANISSKVGEIDVFCSNAGVLAQEGPVIGYDEAQLQSAIMTNLVGSFNALQAFVPHAAPGAKVFNTGSSIGHWQPQAFVPGVFSYAAAKAATLKMVDYFASENPHIHVVSFHPGIIATEINPNITVGLDTVDLPGNFVVWLASEEASFLKGKFVWANWDAEELMARADEIKSSMLLRLSLNGVDM
ncbi:hypothetical protein SCUCBS95973_001081 [Sporothrix curviconia]|uniref:Uncharacterized protein n=1 Tax=Sporothrix curviconia TaxID=1260050 RepID=A0ABP0AVQ9_9PEZI